MSKPKKQRIWCLKCGKPFMANWAIYCPECKKVINRERTSMRARRAMYSHTMGVV